jgi:epoxyqueuosine reductase QueG
MGLRNSQSSPMARPAIPTTNTLLDQMAYRLAVFLNNLGHASIFMPRDGYGSLEILLKKMPACFSHVYAGKYAGLGTIGYSHSLLNPKYGPRALRFRAAVGCDIRRSGD